MVVEDGRVEAQHEAHTIEDEIASERFGGDRYESHLIVEIRDSAPDHDHITDILNEGVTLRETAALTTVKQEVLDNGS